MLSREYIFPDGDASRDDGQSRSWSLRQQLDCLTNDFVQPCSTVSIVFDDGLAHARLPKAREMGGDLVGRVACGIANIEGGDFVDHLD
jgi:hypothetical protein